MYGLKNKSVIFKIRRPETKIGRHNTNHVILSKSLKVSRFHAVINFLSETPLIRDISEWGVFLNGTPIGKDRWAELKLGDVLALGAVKIEDGAHLLEVVPWESEDKTPITNPKIEVIDITDGDDDDDEVIFISEEKGSKAPRKNSAEVPPPINHVPEKISSSDIMVISDTEDEAVLPTLSCNSKQMTSAVMTKVDKVSSTEENVIPSNETKLEDYTPTNTDAATQVDEIPLANENMIMSNEIKFIDCTPMTSVAVTQVDEVPLLDENIVSPNPVKLIDCAFIDVTPTMNGLLLQTSSNLTEPANLPPAFQSILDYSSDDSAVNDEAKSDGRDAEFYSFGEMSTGETTVIPQSAKYSADDVGKTRAQIKKAFDDGRGYKSPSAVFSKYHNDNDGENAESSDLSEASEGTPIKAAAPIIHRTLLTNKIAKIAVISPLPNKSFVKRKRRLRSESPDSNYQRVVNAEHTVKSPNKPKGRPRELQKSLPSTSNQRNMKDTSREKVTKIDSIKNAREKVKALYYGRPVTSERNPSTRPQPKVKITNKNRGDFLTKPELASVPHNPPKPHNGPKNYDNVTPSQSMTKSPEDPRTDRYFSNEAPRSSTARQVESELIPVSSHEPAKSIDAILGGIDIPKVLAKDNFNNLRPIRRAERTIEISIDFSKPSILGSTSKAIGGGSILKKTNEIESREEKKRVEFPREIATTSEVSKKNCFVPPNRFDCGENRRYNYSENGYIARECQPSIMCYNCNKFGHQGNLCPLPDVKKAKQMSRDPRLKNKIINKSRWDVN